MIWLLCLVIASLLFYYFLIKPQLYWVSKNVKQGIPIPLLGDSYGTITRKESMTDMLIRLYNQFKSYRYAGFYQFTAPALFINDLDLIKQLTIKDFDHFLDHRSFMPDNLDPVLINNLFSLKGDKWREMRSTLSPTFTASKMRAMFSLMEKSARQYVNFYINQNKIEIGLELKDSMRRYANDVIATCAFGIDVDSLREPENDFYNNGCEITNTSGFWKAFKFFFYLSAPRISTWLKLSIFPNSTVHFFKNIISDAVSLREKKNIIRPDMIHLLMEARKEIQGSDSAETKKKPRMFTMTEDDMAAQALVFFFAGFDTISTMMSFLCYELAVHPEIQEALRNEIDEVYRENNGKLNYEILNKMTYMDMVISEGMRKNPPVNALDRVCTKAYTIPPEGKDESPVHLSPGDVIIIPVSGIHHNPEYYPNPEMFDPERFSEENKDNIKPYSYLPFGSGPRLCIGSRFALMECKTLMFYILSNFELTVIAKTPIPMKYCKKDLDPAIEGGCWVGLKRRTDRINV